MVKEGGGTGRGIYEATNISKALNSKMNMRKHKQIGI